MSKLWTSTGDEGSLAMTPPTKEPSKQGRITADDLARSIALEKICGNLASRKKVVEVQKNTGAGDKDKRRTDDAKLIEEVVEKKIKEFEQKRAEKEEEEKEAAKEDKEARRRKKEEDEKKNAEEGEKMIHDAVEKKFREWEEKMEREQEKRIDEIVEKKLNEVERKKAKEEENRLEGKRKKEEEKRKLKIERKSSKSLLQIKKGKKSVQSTLKKSSKLTPRNVSMKKKIANCKGTLPCPRCPFQTTSPHGWRMHLKRQHDTTPIQAGIMFTCLCGGNYPTDTRKHSECPITSYTLVAIAGGPSHGGSKAKNPLRKP